MRRSLVLALASSTLVACNFGGGSATSATSATASASAGETSTTTGTTGDVATESDATAASATDSGGWPGFWTGVVCPPVEEEEASEPRIYFDLGAGKDPGKDYFQLPFPIDVRLRKGGVDLEGFPEPPTDLDPAYGAVVERWLSALEIDTAGFAVNGAIFFRASREIGQVAGGVSIVDITPGSPTYGEALPGLRYRNENGSVSRGNYICRNWLAVEPLEGVSLRPDTTYAVLLTDAVRQVGGGAFVQDADFAAMLAGGQPAEVRQADAWPTFAPLRDFLGSPANQGGLGIQAKSLIAGTVFTTAPNLDPLVGARAAARDTAFVVQELHLCEAAGDSPCSIAPGLSEEERSARRCGPPSPDYHEIHGRVRLPIFQEGKTPYAGVGGKITVEGGAPVLRSTFDTCFSLTVPKQASAPAEGWPALVFAHGTDGSFRTAITSGIAPRLAVAGVATIAIDGVIHGERRGDSDDDGEVAGLDVYELVFNVFNPDSARDTIVQGAIDHFSAVRVAEEFSDHALTGETIELDPDRLVFFGHSQGANTGALFLPFEPRIRAAVLSGGGSNLIQALLGKTEPKVQNPVSGEWLAPKELLLLAFQERPDRPLTSMHPMLVLLNTYVNRSDADNTARLLRREPLDGLPAKHALVYIGHVDAYTPMRAAGSLAIGAGMSLGGAPLYPAPCDAYDDDEASAACWWREQGWLPGIDLPAAGNASGVTAVALMRAQAPGKDGHFVAFEPAEIERIAGFLVGALGEGTPSVEP